MMSHCRQDRLYLSRNRCVTTSTQHRSAKGGAWYDQMWNV
uniref:Uncharacterized protein n=1 Tax=Siphoviridae sp. ctg0K17 TaxID=2825600 RepID=A0A8S5PWT8_9CAUD|nr:MAG TPA: hypothetical protein [Siphoviridae sp. ctg0K17]